ncbi:MAG: nucleoside 2-deoxyribosyltransferase, partial [Erysipelotrichaceae bacterium]|nr:nucleoside 2-deoxyribosyltransferase [Erysipelotrichaceae bacterium]
MSRKIYFAGSIRGGRSDAALYRKMIDFLKEDNIVLTEHVGYLAKEVSHNDREIYRQDTDWIRECDLLIAECTCPSLGVGYELAFAEKLNKPCHILYNK